MMRYDEDGQCWTAEHDETFFGWEIMCDQIHKAGVRRVSIRRMKPLLEMRTVYLSDPLAEMAGIECWVEFTMGHAQNTVADLMETQLYREFRRIQREHLSRHTIKLTDAMGSTFISVYADKWWSGCNITTRIIYLEAADKEIPSWLEQLDRLEDWYCRVSDLARVSVELEVTPLTPLAAE